MSNIISGISNDTQPYLGHYELTRRTLSKFSHTHYYITFTDFKFRKKRYPVDLSVTQILHFQLPLDFTV